MADTLFYFDIETVSAYPDIDTLKENDIIGYNLFERKFNKMGWEEKYGDLNTSYKEQGGIISTYGKIVCISFGFVADGKYTIRSFSGEEKDIVENFNNLLKKIEQKAFKLGGYRIFYFDIPWILHKLHKYGIEPANIIYLYDKKPWESRIVDLSEDWKQKFAYPSSFDEVCYELDIDSPKKDLSGSMVYEYFWEKNDIESIVKYCEEDIRACIDVGKKLYFENFS